MRRTLPTIFLAAGALASAAALAQPAAQASATDAAPQRPPMTRDLAATHAAQMFARMDTDSDGRLTEADRAARMSQRQDARFARLDTDGDGQLSRAEFSARPAHADGEGHPDTRREGRREGRSEDRRGGHMMMGGGREAMRTADADSDGAVTQAEFTSAMLARFDAADANRDGTLTREERRAARPMHGGGRGNHGPAHDEG